MSSCLYLLGFSGGAADLFSLALAWASPVTPQHVPAWLLCPRVSDMDFVPLLLSLAGQPLAFYSFAIHSPSVSLRTMTPGIYLDVYLEFVDEIQGVQKLGWTKYILFFFFFNLVHFYLFIFFGGKNT